MSISCSFVIDNDSERIALAREQGMLMYQGNATDENVLQAVQIQEGPVSGDSPARLMRPMFVHYLDGPRNEPNIGRFWPEGNCPQRRRNWRLAGADQCLCSRLPLGP